MSTQDDVDMGFEDSNVAACAGTEALMEALPEEFPAYVALSAAVMVLVNIIAILGKMGADPDLMQKDAVELLGKLLELER